VVGTATDQKAFLTYFEKMHNCYATSLTGEEKRALQDWERAERAAADHLVATSDWPGWEKYIGLPPWRMPTL
jgi:hypothetical protein